MSDDQTSEGDQIGGLIADLEQLRDLTDDLSRKMNEVDAKTTINPEFIRGSLASIYDSQAVLADSVVRVLQTLQANDLELTRTDEIRSAGGAQSWTR
jgi:hypothetical protein